AGSLKGADSISAYGILLEGMRAVFLNGVIQERQWIAIIEEARAGAEDPLASPSRLPGDAETRRGVAGDRRKWRGQTLRFVANAVDERHSRGGTPLILRPKSNRKRGVLCVRIAEGLEVDIRGGLQKIVERRKDENSREVIGESSVE